MGYSALTQIVQLIENSRLFEREEAFSEPARLRGACAAVPRAVRSFALVLGTTIRSTTGLPSVGREATGTEDRLFLAQFDAEELGSGIGFFRGVLFHFRAPVWSMRPIVAGYLSRVKGAGPPQTCPSFLFPMR